MVSVEVHWVIELAAESNSRENKADCLSVWNTPDVYAGAFAFNNAKIIRVTEQGFLVLESFWVGLRRYRWKDHVSSVHRRVASKIKEVLLSTVWVLFGNGPRQCWLEEFKSVHTNAVYMV